MPNLHAKSYFPACKFPLAIPTTQTKPADMKLFESREDLKSKIQSLEADVSTLEAEAKTASEELTNAQEELKTLREQVASAPTSEGVAELQAKLDAAEAAAAPEAIESAALALVAEAKNEAIQLAIANKVAEALAAEGRDPIESNAPEGGDKGNTLTLAEFNALTPYAKSKFSVNGGRITG